MKTLYAHKLEGNTFSSHTVDEIFSDNPPSHPSKKITVTSEKIAFTRHHFPDEYSCWKNAKHRCRNPSEKDKAAYSGIVFSKKFDKFADFMRHIGPMSKKSMSLDRIKNTRGYTVGNVCWATAQQQAVNRATTILIPYADGTVTLTAVEAVGNRTIHIGGSS